MQYRYHTKNSAKGYVHMVYDVYGAAAARDLALKLGKKKSTARLWVQRWNRRLPFERREDAGQTRGLRR